ncbi:MAG TPA: hypothetical protein VOA41_02085 [Candidatus Dormibacteraeota bacterium]|nr:hypothetical protein [Candidatus Dormibacteraeota bacterium]
MSFWQSITVSALAKTRAASLAVAALLLAPAGALAWGANGQRLVVTKAIDTLPPELRAFFEGNREFFLQHGADPLATLKHNPTLERRYHILFLDHYGRFPFDSLPRDYRAAVAKFTRAKIEANGVLPWQIGVFSERLTNAMKGGKWDQARLEAALLAHFVAESHDPFNTTENFDGHLSGQLGVNERFGTVLVDRFSSFFPMHPNDAVYLHDPTDTAFEACLSAHSWLETILLADKRARKGLNNYTDEYYDRFYNQGAAILIRQLSDAATDVGSFWMTSWINAGKPQVPSR